MKYLKILRIALVERLVYRADFFFATILRFLPLVTTLLLWHSVYRPLGRDVDPDRQLSGFTLEAMTAYLLLVQISRMFSSMPDLANGLARDIREGDLKKYLLQPIDLIAYLLAYRGAHKMAYIATSALPYAILFFLFRDVFPGWPEPATFALYVLSLLLAFLVGFFFELCVGMAGFWLLEMSSLVYIIGILNFFISGHMFPLDLLDPRFVAVLKYLPFQYLAYFPAMVFLGLKTGPDLAEGLIIEAAWALALFATAKYLYRRGLQHYGAYGG